MSLIHYDSLKKRSDFQSVYKGYKFFTACFGVHFLPYKSEHKIQKNTIYYGITVSKKNCGCAVKRNKIKRRIRESFRQYALHEFLYDYKIVFTALKKSGDKSWDDYVRAMKKLPELIKQYESS